MCEMLNFLPRNLKSSLKSTKKRDETIRNNQICNWRAKTAETFKILIH